MKRDRGRTSARTNAAHECGYVGESGNQSTPIPESPNPYTAFPYLHVGARYYDPSSGRFLQRDPIGIEDGTNIYAYVESSPTEFIDIDGTARHSYRDPKTGQFAKKPWWRRAPGAIVRKLPPYLLGCVAARIGHKIAGKPYEDPHDVILETIENLIDYGKSKLRDRQKRKENPGAFSAG